MVTMVIDSKMLLLLVNERLFKMTTIKLPCLSFKSVKGLDSKKEVGTQALEVAKCCQVLSKTHASILKPPTGILKLERLRR